MKGYGHYLREADIYLFSCRNENFSIWINKFDNIRLKRTNEFNYSEERYFTKFSPGEYEIKISAPELAIMEMLYLVPFTQTFEESRLIMENLTMLRPALVQKLLEQCSSIKVKRLFLWMAEVSGHEWFNSLDTDRIYLGRGKRAIVKNGVLDKKYNITIPNQYAQ